MDNTTPFRQDSDFSEDEDILMIVFMVMASFLALTGMFITLVWLQRRLENSRDPDEKCAIVHV